MALARYLTCTDQCDRCMSLSHLPPLEDCLPGKSHRPGSWQRQRMQNNLREIEVATEDDSRQREGQSSCVRWASKEQVDYMRMFGNSEVQIPLFLPKSQRAGCRGIARAAPRIQCSGGEKAHTPVAADSEGRPFLEQVTHRVGDASLRALGPQFSSEVRAVGRDSLDFPA